MILYRKEPVPLEMKNTMLLEADGGVVYLSKVTYDQCVNIHSRWDGDFGNFYRHFIVNVNVNDVPGLFEAIGTFVDHSPEPMNMLAPFLVLIAGNKNINWKEASYEDLVGYMHQLSQMLDFYAVSIVPSEVRAKISIPTVILNMYKSSWDDICMSLKDITVINYLEQVKEEAAKGFVEQAPTLQMMPMQPMYAQQVPMAQQMMPMQQMAPMQQVAQQVAPMQQPVASTSQPASNADSGDTKGKGIKTDGSVDWDAIDREIERKKKLREAEKAKGKADTPKEEKKAAPAPKPATPKSSSTSAAASVLDEYDGL